MLGALGIVVLGLLGLVMRSSSECLVMTSPCRLLVLDDADSKTVSDSRASGSEDGAGDDGDSVRPAVGVFAGGDDDGVEEFVAEPVS